MHLMMYIRAYQKFYENFFIRYSRYILNHIFLNNFLNTIFQHQNIPARNFNENVFTTTIKIDEQQEEITRPHSKDDG